MSYDFQLVCELPASPEAIYDAWLSSEGHSAMTGSRAAISSTVEAPYQAWGDYIEGRNIELVPGQRIVQTWRTSDFPTDHPDSWLTVELAPIAGGTRLTLRHRGVPDGQTTYEKSGWREFDFEPMLAYFSKR